MGTMKVIHDDTTRVLREQREIIQRLNHKVSRLKELHESSLALVRRYQDEREGLLDRVQRALLGIEKSEK